MGVVLEYAPLEILLCVRNNHALKASQDAADDWIIANFKIKRVFLTGAFAVREFACDK